jgi:monoterpene epsilon-lactone hydrolase
MSKASWQSRFFDFAIRVMIRRENWGAERALARRARSMLGAPRPYGWIRTRGIRIQPSSHRLIRGEWLDSATSNRGVLLYIHGGGFVCCSAATHRPITGALSRYTANRVFAVDYRLAPEHRYPAALDDVMKAYEWLIRECVDPKSLAVIGDSAGGGLTLSLLLRARDEGLPLPACGVCLSPWVDLVGEGASLQTNNGRCAMFRPTNVPAFAGAYLGNRSPREPYASPVFGDLAALPSLLVQVGSTELLFSDAERIDEKVRATGGVCELQVFQDMFHGWHMLDGVVPEAGLALRDVARFVKSHLH